MDAHFGEFRGERLQAGDLIDAGHARLVAFDGIVLELSKNGFRDHDVHLLHFARLKEMGKSTGEDDAIVRDQDSSHVPA